MQRRRAIEQHRMAAGHFFEDIPDLSGLPFDHLLGRADGMDITEFLEPANDERLEQHERHLFGQTALMQLEFRADDDDRAARVIDAFAEEILAETSALAFEHVAEGFESAIARAGHRAAMAAIIEQGIDGFL